MLYRFSNNSFLIHSKSCFFNVIVLFLGFSNIAFAQVTGYVKSAEGNPIAYALVVKSDYKTGGYTDSKGFFSIDACKNDTLLIKHVAYKDSNIVVKNYQDNLTIYMKDNQVTLNEIIIRPEIKKRRIKRESTFLDGNLFSSKIGFWVKPTEHSNQLVGVDFYITKDGVPTAPFRVGILKNLDNPNGVYKNYMFEGKADKGNRWIEITFQEALEIQDSVLVYIEMLKINNKKPKSKKRKKKGGKMDLLGISIGMSSEAERKLMWQNINETGWMTLDLFFNLKNQFMIEPVFDE